MGMALTMDEKQKPQKVEDKAGLATFPTRDAADTRETERKGDWQGYDPTLLTALLDD